MESICDRCVSGSGLFSNSHNEGYRAVEAIVMKERLRCATKRLPKIQDIHKEFKPRKLPKGKESMQETASFLYHWNDRPDMFVRRSCILITQRWTDITRFDSTEYYRTHEWAGHYLPAHAKSIFYYVEKRFGFKVKKYFDPCAGWGDRLLAVLSAPWMELYVGVDPNPKMTPHYKQIAETFARDGISAQVISKPIEDVVDSDFPIQSPQTTFDLVFTSPPFFHKELYTGDKQSHVRFPSYKRWRDEWVPQLIRQSVRYLRVGGVMIFFFSVK
jgi:hypothetical protein